MEEADVVSRNNTSVSFRQTTPQQSLRRLGLCSPKGSGQQASPVVFPEKRNRTKSSRRMDGCSPASDKGKRDEVRVEIGDEHSDLLGDEVITGNLVFAKGKKSKGTEETITEEMESKKSVVAKLTSKALVWSSSNILSLNDVISVSHSVGVRHFTVHSYPMKKVSCGLSCFVKSKRIRSDFRFLAPSSEEALQWVCGFADQQCFINRLPHPLVSSSKKVFGDSFLSDSSYELQLKCKSSLRMLVILNPRSGRGRSSKVFHGLVEPIFKLAGFEMEVVKTTRAGHAKSLACNADFRTCPDGIICVGGDGIVNEVLNGLLSRDNQKEAISIPIGIIPAGSDNSLVWTVLGVRDPVSAAISIVKGGLTATDVFAVQWVQTGAVHFGMTVSYYGFISDVLELSEKYQRRFGPLRYFVAGLLKFLCLPEYSFQVEYLPAAENPPPPPPPAGDDTILDLYDLYPDVMGRSYPDAFPRASSLSSIDSIMTSTPGRPEPAEAEPSESVRGLDPRSKRLSLGRRHQAAAAGPEEVVRPIPAAPGWPRTRSRSRGWNGLTATTVDREDISSTMSDPGPIWDGEPRWDAEPGWRAENPVELPAAEEREEREAARPAGGTVLMAEEKWATVKGSFLGVLVCNHGCRTVQSLSSLVVAPAAEHDDGSLDLLLVRGAGRIRLLRFFLLLQLGRHLSLGYVDCVKVKSVRITPGKKVRSGCGIDGELCALGGQVVSSLLPEQCRLIGRPHNRGHL